MANKIKPGVTISVKGGNGVPTGYFTAGQEAKMREHPGYSKEMEDRCVARGKMVSDAKASSPQQPAPPAPPAPPVSPSSTSSSSGSK